MTRILVIKPSSLGDIIHGLLVAESIRQQMPDATIDWVARDVFAPLVEACETVDRVHRFYRGGGLGAFGQLIQDIRDEPYDWVLDMQALARSAVISQFSKTLRKRRLCRLDARENAQFACGRCVKLPAKGTHAHAVEILREFLPALDLANELRGSLAFAPPEKPVNLPDDFTLLFPGSRRAEKEWPGFADLTSHLLERGETVVWGGDVAVDGKADWPTEHFLNLTAQTALDALPSLIASARVTVCNDSGPMHLAAAMGKPVVGIFGPTSPEKYGPYPQDAPTNVVVHAPEGDLAKLGATAVLSAVANLR